MAGPACHLIPVQQGAGVVPCMGTSVPCSPAFCHNVADAGLCYSFPMASRSPGAPLTSTIPAPRGSMAWTGGAGAGAPPASVFASQPPVPDSAKPEQTGLSFCELEARLQSSWEDWAREMPQPPIEIDNETEWKDEASCLSLATPEAFPGLLTSSTCELTSTSLEDSLPMKFPCVGEQALQAFSKEGLFCPNCATRSACPFHQERRHVTMKEASVAASWSPPKTVQVEAPALAVQSAPKGKTSIAEEDNSTEAGSSSELCCPSDICSDISDENAVRLEGWRTQMVANRVEEAWPDLRSSLGSTKAAGVSGKGPAGSAGSGSRGHTAKHSIEAHTGTRISNARCGNKHRSA